VSGRARLALVVALLLAGRSALAVAANGIAVSAFASNVGGHDHGQGVTLYVVPDGRILLLTDLLVANTSLETGPLYLSDSQGTRASVALLQTILMPANPTGFSSFLNVQVTFSTGIPFGPGEPVIATLVGGTRGVDVTITGRLVSGPRSRPIRIPGGARDDGRSDEEQKPNDTTP